MPGQEDLELIVRELQGIHQGLREEPPALDEMMERVAEAIVLHARFRTAFKEGTFEVRRIVKQPDGPAREEPFDWKAIDTAE